MLRRGSGHGALSVDLPRLDGVRGNRLVSLLRIACPKLTLGRVGRADLIIGCCIDNEVLKSFAVVGSLVLEHDRSTAVEVGGNVLCLADALLGALLGALQPDFLISAVSQVDRIVQKLTEDHPP